MEMGKVILVISSLIYHCRGISLRVQLEHIANARAESNMGHNAISSRRAGFYQYDPREVSDIVGVPSMPNHLPEAEAILPGHTLIRPSLGMLKSAVKFPHRQLEDEGGVYGNLNNLGIRYDAKNERVLYSGFRRSPSDYIMEKKDFEKQLMKAFASLNLGKKGKTKIFIASLNKNEVDNEKPKNNENEFVPVHYKYLYNLRDTNGSSKGVLRINQDISSSDEKFSEENPTTQNIKAVTKGNWINSHKNFDHIEVNDYAPEYVQFIPKDSKEEIREWWFYSQNDFTEFSGERKL